MPKTTVSYPQVAQACQTLLGEGRKITLRAIVDISGGSPNNVLPLWKQWQQEQTDITFAALDEELSPGLKQAILGECARKVSMVKMHFAKELSQSEQQWRDMQALIQEQEQEKQRLQAELSAAYNRLAEQNNRLVMNEQRLTEAEKQLKEMTERYQSSLIAYERSQAEKIILEKQATDWQTYYHRCEQELKALQTDKQVVEIELATLKARITDKISV